MKRAGQRARIVLISFDFPKRSALNGCTGGYNYESLRADDFLKRLFSAFGIPVFVCHFAQIEFLGQCNISLMLVIIG